MKRSILITLLFTIQVLLFCQYLPDRDINPEIYSIQKQSFIYDTQIHYSDPLIYYEADMLNLDQNNKWMYVGMYQRWLWAGTTCYLIVNDVDKEMLILDGYASKQTLGADQTYSYSEDKFNNLLKFANVVRGFSDLGYELTGILCAHGHGDHTGDLGMLLALLKAEKGRLIVFPYGVYSGNENSLLGESGNENGQAGNIKKYWSVHVTTITMPPTPVQIYPPTYYNLMVSLRYYDTVQKKGLGGGVLYNSGLTTLYPNTGQYGGIGERLVGYVTLSEVIGYCSKEGLTTYRNLNTGKVRFSDNFAIVGPMDTTTGFGDDEPYTNDVYKAKRYFTHYIKFKKPNSNDYYPIQSFWSNSKTDGFPPLMSNDADLFYNNGTFGTNDDIKVNFPDLDTSEAGFRLGHFCLQPYVWDHSDTANMHTAAWKIWHSEAKDARTAFITTSAASYPLYGHGYWSGNKVYTDVLFLAYPSTVAIEPGPTIDDFRDFIQFNDRSEENIYIYQTHHDDNKKHEYERDIDKYTYSLLTGLPDNTSISFTTSSDGSGYHYYARTDSNTNRPVVFGRWLLKLGQPAMDGGESYYTVKSPGMKLDGVLSIIQNLLLD
jgi:hypothetical protein